MTLSRQRPAARGVCGRRMAPGVTLIETLICLTLLAAFLMPLAVMTQSTGISARNTSIHVARSMIINRILSDIDPENPDFYNAYNKTTMQTITINNAVIPYITKVDDSDSNALSHQLYLYVYKAQTDNLNSPFYSYSKSYDLDELRMDCGNTTGGRIDDSGRVWSADTQYDPTTNKTHAGWYTAGAGVASSAVTIDNVSTINNPIYTDYRQAGSTVGNSFEYRFDVPTGDYLVQMYFAEVAGSTTRTLDVTVEGTLQSYEPDMADFNAYTEAGSKNLHAVVRSIPVSVSDGTLNLLVSTKTSSQNARLMGVILRRVE